MAPKLIREGKIEILGHTANSVVYAVAGDSKTGLAKDSVSVLKGGTVWYEGREALGPGKDADESDERARHEAGIYKALGHHDRILGFFGLEIANQADADTPPKAWAVRLERAPCGSLRQHIVNTHENPPDDRTRLDLAVQFAEGVAHIHESGVVWGDLSTRNALLFNQWRIKLGDFADADFQDKYPQDWYGCEVRYCPPGSDRPHSHSIGTLRREIFALGTAICEITEWKVPYGLQTEVLEDEVITALVHGKWPQLSSGNFAEAVIRRCWEYGYESPQEVVDSLQSIVPHFEPTLGEHISERQREEKP